MADLEETSTQETAEPEAPAKKTRTRTTRAKKAEADDAAPAAEDAAKAEEAPVKRGPGRPRKKKEPEASEAPADADGAEEPKPKRGPGRPRKVQPKADTEDAKEASDMPAEGTGSSKDEAGSAPEETASSAPEVGDADAPASDEGEGASEKKKQKRSSSNDHRNGQDRNNQRNNRHNNQHRTRRERNGRQQREYKPSVSKEELEACKLPELREKAAELKIDASGLRKAEMVDAIYEAVCIAEGFIEVEGILDILQDGYGFLRTKGYLPSEHDVYVGLSTIRRNGLRKGDMVAGQTRPAREGEKFAAIQKVTSVNGTPIDEVAGRPKFSDLTPIFPDERLVMEHGKDTLTARVMDLVAPIGKGQRGLIVSPPKAGKTTVLKDIAAAIHANNPEVHLMCLLVDERPEEVTDMERSIHGEVISSTFDMPSDNHIAVAELVIERAKRLVEQGEDVVILLDSITRLARAYNLAQPASGRILSGGVDSTALYPPKRFLGAARNIEGGGSLTILASALVETGSKMDEVIFEEFKGTGNMELRLDRSLADRRIFPAIDPIASGTRKEDLLLDGQEAPLIWAVRRILGNMNNTEKSMDMLIKSLKRTETNQEFILRTAKRAQTQARFDENAEL
ncbi:MAG: transcription termination factor Rho [Eggerthellaceae bacterium]|nr:transcription termination factor Rho [Eggerthellaceae bacterium]